MCHSGLIGSKDVRVKAPSPRLLRLTDGYHVFTPMSVTEILQELPRLSPEDQALVREELDALQAGHLEETPEMLAAIDEGIRSAETEPGHTVEAVRAEISLWLTRSS
jgi:hypothetical protein